MIVYFVYNQKMDYKLYKYIVNIVIIEIVFNNGLDNKVDNYHVLCVKEKLIYKGYYNINQI